MPTSDRHWFLAGGAPDRMASSLRTEDQSARWVPAVPRGLLCRAGRPGVLLPVEVGPGFPWGSLVFLFVALEASVAIAGRWNTERRKQHSRRSATWRNGRVTEPEPCGLFVPNEDQVASVLAEHAQRRSLSVPFGEPRAAREALTISGAGLWPAGIPVGVTGFEPAASSSRTTSEVVENGR